MILQSMPDYISDMEKGDFAFKTVLLFWRMVVGRGSTYLIKWGISIFANKLTSLVRNAKSEGEENDSQQLTEEGVHQAGKQRVQGDLTGRGLRRGIAAVITSQQCTIRPGGLWSTLVTTS